MCEKTSNNYIVEIPPLNNIFENGNYKFLIDVQFEGHYINGLTGDIKLTDKDENVKPIVKVNDIKEPIKNKKAVVTEQKPVVTEQKPVVTEQKPIIKEHKAVVTEQKPIIKEHKAVVTEQKPVVTEQKPIIKEHKTVVTEQKPVVTDNASLNNKLKVQENTINTIQKQLERDRKAKAILRELKQTKNPTKFQF